MRSLRPTMIYPSYKAAENQSDMMRMKKNDDSLGRDTTLCGDPSFLSLMKGTSSILPSYLLHHIGEGRCLPLS